MTLEDKRLECRLARDGSRDYFDGYREKDLKQSLKELMEFKNIDHDGSFMSVRVVRERIKQIFGGLVDEN